VLLSLEAGAFLVAQRLSFWIEFGAKLAKALLQLWWRYASKRVTPQEEAGFQHLSLRQFTVADSGMPSISVEIPFGIKRVWQRRPYF